MSERRDDGLDATASEAPAASAAAAASAATMPASPSAVSGAAAGAPPLSGTLGRYRLERELGAGGMGVVHAAFDPDLERRVALKVLLASGTSDARQRLLREARAMARLSHANVVVVHEVGTASGRDYVAMELIDGGTLAEWVRAERRPPSEIIDAFIAAGRGLAAAHAAELVHRDFKPHNVLRSRDGRILVTDFGLARSTEAPLALAVTAPLRPDAAAALENTPSALSGLTVTGSVLGTPAYMAPEQWAGEGVGPATDQFAFCVALWEALSGARPYGGTTIEELRAKIAAGPAELDASRLPRRVRAILRRGLAPNAADRWPSMSALLAALIRARSRVRFAVAGGAVVVGAAIAAFALLGRSSADAGCPPAHPPLAAWAGELGSAGWTEVAAIAHGDVERWSEVRAHVCTDPAERRVPELACLDGAVARLDLVRQVLATLPPAANADVLEAQLVDPATCARAEPPRLALAPTADNVAALALVARLRGIGARPTTAETEALAARPHLDACGHSLVALVQEELEEDPPRRRALAEQAETLAETCKDDVRIADTVDNLATYDYESPRLGAKGLAAVARVGTVYARVGQPDLAARADVLRARIAAQDEHWPDAFASVQRAIDAYAARGRVHRELEAVIELASLDLRRATVEDTLAARALVAKWRPVVTALHDQEVTDGFDETDAVAAFNLGDVAHGHAELVRLWHSPTTPPVHPIDGRVVDEHGHPVAGATVVSGSVVIADSIGVLFPLQTRGLRSTTSDADGHFTIDSQGGGAVIAQLGDRRSPSALPVDHLTLALEPTRRISGIAQIGTTPRTEMMVTLVAAGTSSYRYLEFAPIQADGTFVIDGAPIERVQLGLGRFNVDRSANVHYVEVAAGAAPVSGVVLAIASTARELDVVVRSTLATPLDLAQIFVFTGHLQPKTVAELMREIKPGDMHTGFAQPASARGGSASRTGDLVLHVTDVPAGELTACAIGLNGSLSEIESPKFQAHVNELELRCAPVLAGATSVIVETPPQKRFD